MRLVSWNCQGAFGKKKDALAALAPDVAVLCEAPLANPFDTPLLDGAVSWQVAGSLPRKSLAVAGFGCELATAVSPVASAGRFSVAVTNGDGRGVLGVWSVPGPHGRYGDEVLGIVEAHAAWIAGGDVVVAGDFNIDAKGVGNGTRGKDLFATLVERLAALGLVSAYHAWTGEPFGAESAMTHYHQRKPDRGFHIDYCFVPSDWRIHDVVVGDPERWLDHSDHMPILVDLAPSTRG